MAGCDFHGFSFLLPGQTPYSHAMVVHRTIEKFCQSAASMITMKHVWIPPATPASPYKSGSRSRKAIKPPTERWVLESARDVWERMHPSGEPAAGCGGGGGGTLIPTTYESVLKVYQLFATDLSTHKYDVVMLDEAQDINDCQADIISRQSNCRVIVVGDPHQARQDERHFSDLACLVYCATLRNQVDCPCRPMQWCVYDVLP